MCEHFGLPLAANGDEEEGPELPVTSGCAGTGAVQSWCVLVTAQSMWLLSTIMGKPGMAAINFRNNAQAVADRGCVALYSRQSTAVSGSPPTRPGSRLIRAEASGWLQKNLLWPCPGRMRLDMRTAEVEPVGPTGRHSRPMSASRSGSDPH